MDAEKSLSLMNERVLGEMSFFLSKRLLMVKTGKVKFWLSFNGEKVKTGPVKNCKG